MPSKSLSSSSSSSSSSSNGSATATAPRIPSKTNANAAKEGGDTVDANVAAAATEAARLPLPTKSRPKSDTSMPRLEEEEIKWKIPEQEEAADLNPWSLAALETNQGQGPPLTPLRSSTLSSTTLESSSTIAVKYSSTPSESNANTNNNSNRKNGSGGGLFHWCSRSSQTPNESSSSTTTATPLSFYNRYTPHNDNNDDDDEYFNSFISTPQSTNEPTSRSTTTTQPHWTRDYNAIEACERAEAFRVGLYEWIQWCMAACCDAMAAVLFVLYGVALVVERLATKKRSTVSTVVLSVAFALSVLYGVRSVLILFLLRRQKLQRSSGSGTGQGSLCVWTFATIILSLVLAVLYMVATIVMMDDSLSFHHHANPRNETNPNDNDHNSTLLPNNATMLVDNSLAWSKQRTAHAVVELLSVQDSSHYHWLSTMLQRHAHELLIPQSWLDYVQRSHWEDLLWVVFLCLALWEVFARAWFSHTTRHYHYPHVNLEATNGRTGNGFTIRHGMTRTAWHEDDDFNYTHGGQGRSSGSSLMMRLFPPESSSLNDAPLLDHRANSQTRSKSWFGFGRGAQSNPTSAFSRHDDEDYAHLFAALNEDWADRARDDPLWWSRD